MLLPGCTHSDKTLQLTATHCNALQLTAARCNAHTTGTLGDSTRGITTCALSADSMVAITGGWDKVAIYFLHIYMYVLYIYIHMNIFICVYLNIVHFSKVRLLLNSLYKLTLKLRFTKVYIYVYKCIYTYIHICIYIHIFF